MNIDWDAIRVQYELFHEDVEVLAQENGTTAAMIEYAIADKGWRRAPMKGMMHEVRDVAELSDLTDDVLSSVSERMGTINVLKAAAMNPKYIALETAILGKAKEIVSSLMPSAPTAGDQLKKVAEVLQKLREQSIPAIAGTDQHNDDGRVMVQIMNNVDLIQSEPKKTPVVEISQGSSEETA